MLEDAMRFKKCAALLGLLVAFSSFGLAVGKVFSPARLGVWVGPATGFVIGLPAQGPRERQLLGDSFAPFFTLAGVIVGRSSWTFLHRLRVDGGEPPNAEVNRQPDHDRVHKQLLGAGRIRTDVMVLPNDPGSGAAATVDLSSTIFRLVMYEFLKFNHRGLAVGEVIQEHLIFPVRQHDAMS
jgi:hypothetical protein